MPDGNIRGLMFPFESLLTRHRAAPRSTYTVAINYKRLIFPARSSIIVACVNVTDCVCDDKKRRDGGEGEGGERGRWGGCERT